MRTQIKAARTLLSMTQTELCEKAGVPLITLCEVEGRPDHAGLESEEYVARITKALEAKGIQLLTQAIFRSGRVSP